MAPDETVEDRILGGKLVLRQTRDGYRTNADSLLLAAAAPAVGTALDAGCGAGGSLLAAAWRLPDTRWVGEERDPAMAALAQQNVRANGLETRVTVETADVLHKTGGSFDLVQCNPPFAQAGEGSAPHPGRVAAHVSEASIDAWIAALSNRLAGGGVLTLIHRADRIDRILHALDGRLGDVTIFPVWTKPDRPARRVLVRARKGSRAPVQMLRGLSLVADAELAEAIFRGEAALPW